MSIDESYGRTFLYVKYSFLSMMDYSISKQCYNKIEENKINTLSSEESLYFYENYQKAYFDNIIYSALSLESFINKIGHILLKNKYFTESPPGKKKTYERLSTKDKWTEILRLAIIENINQTDEFINKILKLFNDRDELVHDKPITNPTSHDLQYLTYNSNYDPITAFKLLIDFNNFISDQRINNKKIYLVKREQIIYYNELIENKYQVVVEESLPFSLAKFNSLIQYKLYYRFKTGADINVKQVGNRIVHN